jgi:hypothetical protein
MDSLSAWFHAQLTSSAEAFAWAVEQVPEEHRTLPPPSALGEWSVARHVFHLLAYERRLALPNMRLFWGESFTKDATYQEEIEWTKGHNLDTLLADFRRIRAEEMALLSHYTAKDWGRTMISPNWEDVTLRWIVTKTLQHTFDHTSTVLAMSLFWDFFAQQEAGDHE